MPYVDGGAGLPPVEVDRKIDLEAFLGCANLVDCLPRRITIDMGFVPIACDAVSATFEAVLHEGTWAIRAENWPHYCGEHGRVSIPVLLDGEPVGNISVPADPHRSNSQFDVCNVTVARTDKHLLTLQADLQTIRSNMQSLFLAAH